MAGTVYFPYDAEFSIPATLYEVLATTQLDITKTGWPSWTDVVRNDTSLLRSFIAGPTMASQPLSYLSGLPTKLSSNDGWTGEPRLGWVADCPLTPESIQTVAITVTSGSYSVKLCATPHEFMVTLIPCCLWNEGALYFKNLSRALLTISVSGTIDISDLAPHQEDQVLVNFGADWFVADNALMSTTTLGYTVTGDVQVSALSPTLTTELSSGSASINSGPPVNLEEFIFWTSLDEVGMFQNLSRFPDEENIAYWERLKLRSSYPGNISSRGYSLAISHFFGLCSGATVPSSGMAWVSGGPTTLNFGYFQPSNSVWHTSIQTPSGYASPYGDLTLVYLQDVGRIFAATETSGLITSTKSLVNPDLWGWWSSRTEATSGRHLISLTPSREVGDNIPSAFVYGVRCQGLPYADDLYDPGGGATTELKNLAPQIAQQAKTSLGFVEWANSVWHTIFAATPEIEYLPEVLE